MVLQLINCNIETSHEVHMFLPFLLSIFGVLSFLITLVMVQLFVATILIIILLIVWGDFLKIESFFLCDTDQVCRYSFHEYRYSDTCD